VGTFEPGHVSIVGPNLPHDWVSDLSANEVILDRDAVIQFTEEWIARASLVIPELHGISSLVNSSRRGIVFSGPTAVAAAAEIESVGAASGPQRIGLLFSLLATFMTAPDSDRRYITDDVYTTDVGAEGKAAVDAGLAYMLENLTGRVSMAEAARLALMSESSFSKYFKRASGLTFSDMVKRLRIANACRLLDQTASSVSSISRAVGYTNLANFNRQFLTETGVAPRAYRALDHEHKPHSKLVGLGRVSALRTLS